MTGEAGVRGSDVARDAGQGQERARGAKSATGAEGAEGEREALKRAAAERAAGYVESGMVVGLGAGTTAAYATQRIGALIAAGRLRDVRGVPCSETVAALARAAGVPLTTLERDPAIDLTIDGADEVDPRLNLIKGGGGALLREKIVAQASRREVIVVDEAKLSPALGTAWPVPVEVVPFGWGAQVTFLQSLGARVVLRRRGGPAPAPGGGAAGGSGEGPGNGEREGNGSEEGGNGSEGQGNRGAGEGDGSAGAFRTDGGNLILDCHFGPFPDPEALAALDGRLGARAGIVEHGLFLGLASEVIVAGPGGLRHLSPQAPSGRPPGARGDAGRQQAARPADGEAATGR